eukprot:m.127462 g.127462  ORF g.127462 m.127462 type:complete len:368 (+) comp23545_c0_seq3:148-1251(+)
MHAEVIAIAVFIGILCSLNNANSHILVIFGGTGAQGRTAIDTVLARTTNPHTWLIRTLTRNASSPQAQALAALGIEVHEGSYTDVTVLDRLFHSAYGVFAVTFTSFEEGQEVAHGRDIARAAFRAGVKHFIFSSGERTGLDILDSKANIEDFIRRETPFPYQLFLHSGFFFENLVFKSGQQRFSCEVHDGELQVTFANPFPADFSVVMHSASDVGRLAALALLRPRRFTHGSAIRVVGGRYTGEEFARSFSSTFQNHFSNSRAHHKPTLSFTSDKHSTLTKKRLASHGIEQVSAQYVAISLPNLRRMIPGKTGQVISDMYTWFLDQGNRTYDSPEAVALARSICPEALTLNQWWQKEGIDLLVGLCL